MRRVIGESWPALLVGVLAFLGITRGKIARPGFTDWLMAGDPTIHYLGWQFFRHGPFVQWPVGANPSFGLDVSNSIVFTDSIPLLAISFKAIDRWLPDTFQYFGWWILLCFLLQALFGWKLLGLFSQDRWLRLIGTVFFVMAPALLWRLHGHFALLGHWMILAALYFYFSKHWSGWRWAALLVTAVLVHAYLAAMVAAVWAADAVQRILQHELTPSGALVRVLATGGAVMLVMWATGYFMIGTGIEIGGFGQYRMNLLALIDPDDIWSRLLRDRGGGAGDYEGFNFLGLGMLGILLVAGYEVVARGRPDLLPLRRALPIVLVSIVLSLFALSNRIAFGSHEVFAYNVPRAAGLAVGIFRVSGRFFWPVYYLIYLLAFYVMFARVRRSAALALCSVMCLVQVADTVDAWKAFALQFTHPPTWVSPMVSPAWREIATRYRKILLVLPQNAPEDWIPLCQFAAEHHMAINTGYFARVDLAKQAVASARLSEAIITNRLERDALYVFQDEGLWETAQRQASPSDFAGTLDGFRVVAPGLRDCGACAL